MINEIKITYVDSLIGFYDSAVYYREQYPDVFDKYIQYIQDCEKPLCNCYYIIELDDGTCFNKHYVESINEL